MTSRAGIEDSALYMVCEPLRFSAHSFDDTESAHSVQACRAFGIGNEFQNITRENFSYSQGGREQWLLPRASL